MTQTDLKEEKKWAGGNFAPEMPDTGGHSAPVVGGPYQAGGFPSPHAHEEVVFGSGHTMALQAIDPSLINESPDAVRPDLTLQG